MPILIIVSPITDVSVDVSACNLLLQNNTPELHFSSSIPVNDLLFMTFCYDVSATINQNIVVDANQLLLELFEVEARPVYYAQADHSTLNISITTPKTIAQNNKCGNACTVPNSYFNFRGECYDNEKFLFSKVTSEAFNMHGLRCDYFVVSYSTTNNKLLGEDNDRKIIGKFPVTVYADTPPEERKYNQFGMEDLDNFVMFCTKMLFNKYSKGYIPKYGDLIRPHYNGIIYEIVDVIDTEGQFLNTQHIWKFSVKVWKNYQPTYAVTPTCATSAENMQTYDRVNAIAIQPPVELQPTSAAVTSGQDYLRHNDIVTNKKSDILYKSNPTIDPFDGW